MIVLFHRWSRNRSSPTLQTEKRVPLLLTLEGEYDRNFIFSLLQLSSRSSCFVFGFLPQYSTKSSYSNFPTYLKSVWEKRISYFSFLQSLSTFLSFFCLSSHVEDTLAVSPSFTHLARFSSSADWIALASPQFQGRPNR